MIMHHAATCEVHWNPYLRPLLLLHLALATVVRKTEARRWSWPRAAAGAPCAGWTPPEAVASPLLRWSAALRYCVWYFQPATDGPCFNRLWEWSL